MRMLTFALLLLCTLSAQAAAPSDVERIESYLRGLSTLKSRFIQTSHDGSQVAGNFMMKRPGRMRFTYDAPIEDFIVADGIFVYYYDSQLQEQSSTPISQSLADFFLRKDLRLSGDIQVSGLKKEGGILQITLAQASDPQAGSLILGFSQNPLQLKKWRVIDAQGLVTEVELFDIQTGIKLDNDLFHYYDPQRKKPAFN